MRNNENIVEMIDQMDPGGREYITQVMSPTAVPLPLSTGAGDDSFLDGFAEGSLPTSVFEGSFDVAGGSIEAQYAFGMPGGTPARVPPGEDGEGDDDDDYEEPPPRQQGRALGSSPSRGGNQGGGDDPDATQMLKFFMNMMKTASQGSSDNRSSTLRLAKMPGCGDHVLPSVKDWQQWYDVKFRSWAGAQATGFAEAVDAMIKRGDPHDVKTKFAKENRVLADEICHMVDGRLLSYLVKMDKTDGALF